MKVLKAKLEGDPEGWMGTLVFVAAVIVAAFLRLDALTIKPLHSDEGVNGWFLMNLYRGLHRTHGWLMNYRYDPTAFHGPFLYFVGLVSFFLFGPSVTSLRLLPAVAGVACVAGLWPVRKWLGWAGLVTAAFLMAVSPTLVFFSRTAIHETYVLLFSLLSFVCIVRCYAGAGEQNAPRYRSNWLLFAAINMALLFANKETSAITFGVYVAAGGVAWFASRGQGGLRDRWRVLRSLKPHTREERWEYTLAFGWAVAIVVILFSSFFNNPRGVWDMIDTYKSWIKFWNDAGSQAKPFGYWIEVLLAFEAPVLWLALLGTAAALWRRDPFSIFVAMWAWTMGLVYSVISYKTPWLALNFIGPACLLGGIFVREMLCRFRGSPYRAWLRLPVLAILPLMIVLWPVHAGPVLSAKGGNQHNFVSWWNLSWDVNLVHFEDDRYKLVYAQTVHDFENMVSRLRMLFDKRGEQLTVWVSSGDHWPLPFYMRDRESQISYGGDQIPPGLAPNVVIASSKQDMELRPHLLGYHREQYLLRPGIVLALYVDRVTWDSTFGSLNPPETAVSTPDASSLAPGIMGEYQYGVGCVGDLLARRIDEEPHYSGDSEFRAPLCVTWTGFVKIDKEGEYSFTTRSDDGSWVWLDGQLVVDNGGLHRPITRTGESRHLKPGLHPIIVRYFDAGGGADLAVSFRLMGSSDQSLKGRLFHEIEPGRPGARPR